MVDRGGRLGHWRRLRSLSSFFLSCRYMTSSPRLCVAVEIPRVVADGGFPTGVGRSGEAGWVVARSFPYPGRFHSRGGELAGGGGPTTIALAGRRQLLWPVAGSP